MAEPEDVHPAVSTSLVVKLCRIALMAIEPLGPQRMGALRRLLGDPEVQDMIGYLRKAGLLE